MEADCRVCVPKTWQFIQDKQKPTSVKLYHIFLYVYAQTTPFWHLVVQFPGNIPLFPNIDICSQILERSQGRSPHYLGLPGAFNPIVKTSPQLGHLHMECPPKPVIFQATIHGFDPLRNQCCYWYLGPSVRLIASLSTCFGSTTEHFLN